GSIKENTFFTESELSKKFETSTSPVREALQRLIAEKFVESIPHKGYVVTTLSLKELRDLFQLRVILENAAVKLAIQNSNVDSIKEIEDYLHQEKETES